MLIVPQPVWVEVPVSTTPEETGQSPARAPSGPRIESSPYYRVERYDPDWRDPLLGISAEEVGGQLATRLGVPGGQGVVIRQVVPGSPAESAGLLPGDVIVSVDGKPVRTMDELRWRLRGSLDPKNIPVSVLRGGVQMSVFLQVG